MGWVDLVELMIKWDGGDGMLVVLVKWYKCNYLYFSIY